MLIAAVRYLSEPLKVIAETMHEYFRLDRYIALVLGAFVVLYVPSIPRATDDARMLATATSDDPWIAMALDATLAKLFGNPANTNASGSRGTSRPGWPGVPFRTLRSHRIAAASPRGISSKIWSRVSAWRRCAARQARSTTSPRGPKRAFWTSPISSRLTGKTALPTSSRGNDALRLDRDVEGSASRRTRRWRTGWRRRSRGQTPT